MNAEYWADVTGDDGDPGPFIVNINDIDPAVNPPPVVYVPLENEAAMPSEERPVRSENPLLARYLRQYRPPSDTRSSDVPSLTRSGYSPDLESQAVTSDDMSTDNEITLAQRTRRRNAPLPIARIASQLRQFHDEELRDSSVTTPDMLEEIPLPLRPPSPPPLVFQTRGRNPFQSPPTTDTIDAIKAMLPPIEPPAERRRVQRREDGLLAFAPRSSDGPAFSTTSAYVPADYGYGYGYEGYDRSHFYVLEDVDNKRPVSDPIGLRPDARFVEYNPYVLAGDEMEVLEAQEYTFDRPDPSSSDLSSSEHRGRSRTRRPLN